MDLREKPLELLPVQLLNEVLAQQVKEAHPETTNISPWLEEIPAREAYEKLQGIKETDIAIIGAGIAGVMTAYYALAETTVHVSLVESKRLANGATGHNGGHAIPTFEMSYGEIVAAFGVEKAKHAQQSINTALQTLITIGDELGEGVVEPVLAYEAISTQEQLDEYLENIALQEKHGVCIKQIRMPTSSATLIDIKPEHSHLVSAEPDDLFYSHLETTNSHYIAALCTPVGLTNSALLCEKLIAKLKAQYPDRFKIYEESPITEIANHEAGSINCSTDEGILKAQNVILCTNGYSLPTIIDEPNPQAALNLKNSVYGMTGYMVGYIDTKTRPTAATAYLEAGDSRDDENSAYTYATRRRYTGAGVQGDLVCIGGTFRVLKNEEYNKEDTSWLTQERIPLDKFVATTPVGALKDYPYAWHGLMGYTETNMRMVGPVSSGSRIQANIGCCGIGLLTSIAGAQRCIDFVQAKPIEPSVFDINN